MATINLQGIPTQILLGENTQLAAISANAAATSAAESRAWAEGPGEPGGPGTKSALEHAADAAASVSTFRDTLSEWGARAYTYTNGSYIKASDGTLVADASYRYFYYTLDPADTVAGVAKVRVTNLHNISSAGALAVYYNGSTYLGYQFLGTGSAVQYTDQDLTLPTGTTKIGFSGLIGTTTTHTIKTLRVTDGIASRLTTQEALTTPIPSVVTSLSGYEAQTLSYVADNLINRTTGAPVSNTLFHYAVVNVDEAAGERLKVTAGTFNAGSTYAAIVYFSGANMTGTVLGSSVTGNSSAQDVPTVIGGDGIPTLPAGTKSAALSQRYLDTAYQVQKYHVSSSIVARVETLESASGVNGPIALWGESTATSGTNGIQDDLAAAYPSRTIYDGAIGGQQFIDQVQYRMGVAGLTLTVTDGSVPKSGATVACTLNHDILKPPTNVDISMRVMVDGIRLRLWRNTSGTYTVNALDSISADFGMAGARDVTVLSGHSWTSDPTSAPSLKTMLSGTNIIRGFYNDRYSTDTAGEVAALQAAIAQVSRYSFKQLWIGPNSVEEMLLATANGGTYTYGTATSAAQSYLFLSNMRYFNSIMKNLSPQYFDCMAFWSAKSGTVNVTVSGVVFPVLTSTATLPVTQSGGPHETTTNQELLVNDPAGIVATLAALKW